jgi:ferrous iron transport protein A
LKSLADLPTGTRTVVHTLQGGREFVSRLSALGFTSGTEVKVVQNYRHGPLIVLVRGTRVALGRGEASRVLVAGAGNEHDPVA